MFRKGHSYTPSIFGSAGSHKLFFHRTAGMPGVLMGPNDQPGGGSGGAPVTFSDEQWSAIESRFLPMIQGAVSSMSKRIEKQVGDRLGEALGGIDKKLDGLKVAPPNDEPPGLDGKTKGRKEDVELAAMKRQIELQTASLKEFSDKYEVERQKNRALDFGAKTTAALDAVVGIKDPFMAKLALSYLRDEGRLAHEDDGSILFNDANGPIPLEMGLKSWAKTEEAKRFIPASGVRGSGSRPGGSPNTSDKPMTRDQAAVAMNSLLDDALSGH